MFWNPEVITTTVKSLRITQIPFNYFEPVWQLQPDRERFIPVMESYWKTYPPVYLYYPKNAGKTKRVKALIDFLISTTGR